MTDKIDNFLSDLDEYYPNSKRKRRVKEEKVNKKDSDWTINPIKKTNAISTMRIDREIKVSVLF